MPMPAMKRTLTVTTAMIIAGEGGEPVVPTVNVVDEVEEMGKKMRGRTAMLANTNKTTMMTAIAFALASANATTVSGA